MLNSNAAFLEVMELVWSTVPPNPVDTLQRAQTAEKETTMQIISRNHDHVLIGPRPGAQPPAADAHLLDPIGGDAMNTATNSISPNGDELSTSSQMDQMDDTS